MKRRESFKTTSNDPASYSLSSNLTNGLNDNSSTANTGLLTPINNKLKLKDICITMPVAKPSINELKPQLSIENKHTKSAKTLIER